VTQDPRSQTGDSRIVRLTTGRDGVRTDVPRFLLLRARPPTIRRSASSADGAADFGAFLRVRCASEHGRGAKPVELSAVLVPAAALRRDYRRATKKQASMGPFPLISTMPRGSTT
jgi:hypothetical protein